MKITQPSHPKMSFTEEELFKALGSRGGRIIGTTRSGKPIYSNFNHESHTTFNSKDHYDAHAVHTHLSKIGRSTSSMSFSNASHEAAIKNSGSSADSLAAKNTNAQKAAHGAKRASASDD